MSMDQKDALEMANDLGASYAVLFDLRIDRKSEDRRTRTVTCFMSISLYDSRTNQMIGTLEIEGDSEQTASRRGGRSAEPSEAVYDAIQSVVGQAAKRVHAMVSPKAKGDRKKTARYEMTLKNFDQGEISGLVKKVESIKGFSKLKQIEQTARSYRMEVSTDLDLNDFLAAMTEILDGSNFQYNLNFDQNKVYITKSRAGGEGKEGEGKVDL
ncbi:MAG: hypothetical protein HZA01_17220 [Nitrospinae bacterium]|nr:hypothetical protein [Nitrospinota bacterium]